MAIIGVSLTLATLSILLRYEHFGPGSATYQMVSVVTGILLWLSGSILLMPGADTQTCKRWAIGTLIASILGCTLMPFANIHGAAGFIMLSAFLCLPLSLSSGITARRKSGRIA